MRWKRSLLLVLALAGLFFIALAEDGGPASSKAITSEIIALLNDPLNLLDERSPGGRGSRVLLSIKGPHERVLSTVRERESPIPPVVDNPAFATPEAVASIPMIPPEYETPPSDQLIGSPSFPSFNPTTPLDYPNIAAGGAPTPNVPVAPAVSSGGAPTSQAPAPPAGPADGTPAPSARVPPPALPGTPPTPGITVVPEPATWTMMILGLFAIGAGVRRGARK
jgi:hypothetical protein